VGEVQKRIGTFLKPVFDLLLFYNVVPLYSVVLLAFLKYLITFSEARRCNGKSTVLVNWKASERKRSFYVVLKCYPSIFHK
jgi:hypothetical protein